MNEWNLNIMLAVTVIAALIKMVDGYRKGMVKEVISLVSLVVLSVVAALLAYGVNSYHDGKVFNVVAIAVLLILLLVAHHLLGLVFFSAKLATKLPVVHFLDKLLGIVFGAFEVVLVLWTLYALMMMMDIGAVGEFIREHTQRSEILKWIYDHNYLAKGIEGFLDRFRFIPLIGEIL